jgi:DNA-binding transcriptional LysR family regulator
MMNFPAWRAHPRGPRHLRSHTLTLNQGQFAVLDVEGFPILPHWYAVYPAGRQLSVVARAFLDYLLGRGDAVPAAATKKK